MVKPNIDTSSNSAVVKKFTAFLESRQLRKTPERFAILRCVLSFVRHFTIDDLQQSLEEQNYHVSRATLYATLNLLVEGEMLRRHLFEGLPTQYERVGAMPHNHLVCTACGKVKEVRDSEFVAFMNARKYNAFTATHYSITVYGMCSTCSRKAKKLMRKASTP